MSHSSPTPATQRLNHSQLSRLCRIFLVHCNLAFSNCFTMIGFNLLLTLFLHCTRVGFNLSLWSFCDNSSMCLSFRSFSLMLSWDCPPVLLHSCVVLSLHSWLSREWLWYLCLGCDFRFSYNPKEKHQAQTLALEDV